MEKPRKVYTGVKIKFPKIGAPLEFSTETRQTVTSAVVNYVDYGGTVLIVETQNTIYVFVR
jgi:hypothetical protein